MYAPPLFKFEIKTNAMNKKVILLLLCICGIPLGLSAQKMAVKTNLLYDATSTINIGAEFKVGARKTLELPFNYNPWTFSDQKKFKHLLFQPELRWWLCEPFTGHFWGVHAHGGIFNVGNVGPLDITKDYRHEGWLVGGGVSYGYSFILGKRWSLEATVGVGYAYIDYERYECEKCGDKLKDGGYHYFGPTKLGLTLVFMIK